MSNAQPVDIIVQGAGPAGTIAAIKLQQLGFAVAVVTQPSRYPAVIEGISQRSYQALENIGLQQLCAAVSPAVPRYVDWGERSGQANGERLIHREVFNAALLAELRQRNIALQIAAKVTRQWSPASQQWRVAAGAHSFTAPLLIEACGRQARVAAEPCRAAATVSLHQHWQRPAAAERPPYTAVAAVAQGWLWYVHAGDGQIYTQLCCGGDSAQTLSHSAAAIAELAADLDPQLFALDDASARGELLSRGATPRLNRAAASRHLIAVGDAALAADPLSGNGIYQSISSALIAPAVANTLLTAPDRAELAIDFYQQRINHLYQRFGRLGREFYADEQRFRQQPFWQQRLSWPDAQPSHAQPDQILGSALRAVVEDDLISRGEVVITANHPLGIWRIGGELACERLRRHGTPLPALD
jgi:2-polyprenyl-6-methoxyphenol hydroxylase-like FAD-dependent oxidoreductase